MSEARISDSGFQCPVFSGTIVWSALPCPGPTFKANRSQLRQGQSWLWTTGQVPPNAESAPLFSIFEGPVNLNAPKAQAESCPASPAAQEETETQSLAGQRERGRP